MKEVLDKVTEKINEIIQEGITPDNLGNLGKLVDIHKDIKNEEYWEKKEENYMRYGNYGRGSYGEYGEDSYGRRSRDSRGRYTEGSYGKRGYDSKYRGHDMLDEMSYSYGAYSEGNEYGDYGASTNELEKMLDCNVALIEHLKKNAKSQEEMQIIDRKVQEMSRI